MDTKTEIKRIDGIDYVVEPMPLQDWFDAGKPGDLTYTRTGLRIYEGWARLGRVIRDEKQSLNRDDRWYDTFKVEFPRLSAYSPTRYYGTKTVWVVRGLASELEGDHVSDR